MISSGGIFLKGWDYTQTVNTNIPLFSYSDSGAQTITCMVQIPNQQKLIYGTGDGNVRMINLAFTVSELSSFSLHTLKINRLLISPSLPNLLISCSEDTDIKFTSYTTWVATYPSISPVDYGGVLLPSYKDIAIYEKNAEKLILGIAYNAVDGRSKVFCNFFYHI